MQHCPTTKCLPGPIWRTWLPFLWFIFHSQRIARSWT
jgi:hypothetical protein